MLRRHGRGDDRSVRCHVHQLVGSSLERPGFRITEYLTKRGHSPDEQLAKYPRQWLSMPVEG